MGSCFIGSSLREFSTEFFDYQVFVLVFWFIFKNQSKVQNTTFYFANFEIQYPKTNVFEKAALFFVSDEPVGHFFAKKYKDIFF